MSRRGIAPLFNRRSPDSFDFQPGRHHFQLPAGHHRDGIFTHPEFPEVTTKFGRGLISWCIYQNVACRVYAPG
jgi:hypothetical protein